MKRLRATITTARRISIVLVSLLFVALSLNPTAVLAAPTDPEQASSGAAIKGYLTDTAWYDPTCSIEESATDTLPFNIPTIWRDLLTRAAASRNTSASLLAAIYLTENGNEWRPFDYAWPTSSAGARGPFQFLPGTWDGHKVDADGDGVMDVMDPHDAAFAAADMIADIGAKPDTPLGDIIHPMTRDTLLYVAVAYNQGPGFAERSDPNMTLTALSIQKPEGGNYALNVNEVISSGFTNSGYLNYADPHSIIPGESTINPEDTGDCRSSSASGIVEIALELAWNTGGHGKERYQAKPEYADETYPHSMPKANPQAYAQGGDVWSDCGVFVATVVLASGVDPSYPYRGTYNQVPYLDSGQTKWEVFKNVRDPSFVQPGDILIFNGQNGAGHTYIFVGTQHGPDGDYNSVSASFHDHVPEASNLYLDQKHFDRTLGEAITYHFWVVRLR